VSISNKMISSISSSLSRHNNNRRFHILTDSPKLKQSFKTSISPKALNSQSETTTLWAGKESNHLQIQL